MGRKILSVLAGLIAAMATFFIVEQLGHSIYPAPAGLNFEDAAAVKAFMDNRPIGAYLLVLGGWLLGTLEAGFIAQKISRETANTIPFILGGILTASAALNFFLLPHPVWFVVVGLIVFVPMALVGWKLSQRFGS
ncbi:MAG: hypothetical protein ACOVSW_11210 [Candidatus Kapaibacteriota bacterium]|jgi:hypothetical protein